jgi:branched-chain amino acid transport system substrate-binding protein
MNGGAREEPMTIRRKNGISRRRFMATSAGAALATNFPAPAILAQSRAPLRLGNLNSFTGAIAYSAENNLNGMNLYFDSIGGSVAGRKVEIIKEDDQFNPQIGLQ